MSSSESTGGARGELRVVMVCTGNICRSAIAEIVLVDRLLAAGVPVLPSLGAAPAPRLARGGHRALGTGSAVPARPGTGGEVVDRAGVVVTSAGVSDEEHGNPIDPRAARVLAEHGYGQGTDSTAREVAARIRSHRAHRISDAELAGADLVLAMTARHLRELERRAAWLPGAADGRLPGATGLPGAAAGAQGRPGAAPPGGVARLGGALAGPRIRLYRALDPALADERAGTELHRDRHGTASAVPDVPDPWYGTMADFEDTLAVVERVSDELAHRLGRP